MSNINVKEWRVKQGFTQEELAGRLEMSRNTLLHIEKGDRELSLSEAKKLTELMGVSVEALLGQQLPDFGKYQEMLLYVLGLVKVSGRRGIPKTKLAKILYLADFAWYYDNICSISGMSYRRLPYGPVPNEYFVALDLLESSGLIAVQRKKHGIGETQYLSLTRAGSLKNLERLGISEKKLIKKIYSKWEKATTSEIVSFTHEQLPYALAFDGEIIEYALIGQMDRQDLF